MVYELGKADLLDIATGGCFFGSGGGGTLESARNLISHFKKGEYYPAESVRVVSVDEAVKEGGESVVVAYLGAPVMINKTLYPYGPELAVEQVRAKLEKEGRTLRYIVPPESGALGFVVACLVAARLGLSVIDGDGAGRAVPSLPQLTFASEGVDPRPAVLVSESRLSIELNVSPAPGNAVDLAHHEDVARIIDNLLRPIVAEPEFNQFGGLAIWVMDPETLQRALKVRGTLERARKLGETLRRTPFRSAEEMVDLLKAAFDLPARIVFGPASFVSASQGTVNGFDIGKIVLSAAGRICTVVYQNESLLAWTDGDSHPLCMAPDSLSYFIEGEGESIVSNGDLLTEEGEIRDDLKGRNVSLIGLAADPVLTEKGSDLLANFMSLLGSLGYYGGYVPFMEPQNAGGKRR